jgi:hypothetical protein
LRKNVSAETYLQTKNVIAESYLREENVPAEPYLRRKVFLRKVICCGKKAFAEAYFLRETSLCGQVLAEKKIFCGNSFADKLFVVGNLFAERLSVADHTT